MRLSVRDVAEWSRAIWGRTMVVVDTLLLSCWEACRKSVRACDSSVEIATAMEQLN